MYRHDFINKQTCYHSQFPTTIKEAHVFELNNELYVCSSFTGISKVNLNCWKWGGASGWGQIETPSENGIGGFISSVYIPNIGMWFIEDMAGKSLILSESTSTFIAGPDWTILRNRACTVLLTNTKVAQIGGDGTGAVAVSPYALVRVNCRHIHLLFRIQLIPMTLPLKWKR